MSGPVTDGHLGGYLPGGDPATWFPDMWTWLVSDFGVKSVLDVGCGDGSAVDYFTSLGIPALGVEGIPQDHPRIEQHDFAEGPWPSWNHYFRFDLVWCCEFVEHVEERFIPRFLPAFQTAPIVLLTHAEPGQPGYHHVNCRSADYWEGVMMGISYKLDPDLTAKTRELAAKNTFTWEDEQGVHVNHYLRSGLAFRRM